jgi:Bardet-Biedl syndrome 1 protein
VLPRSANLEAGSAAASGPPPEQDVPLPIPKKTKLYLEQAQREREGAINMHRVFQRELCKLRLSTARSLVKVLSDGQVGRVGRVVMAWW